MCLAVYVFRTEQGTGIIFNDHVELSSPSTYTKFGDILIILSRDIRNNIQSVLFGEAFDQRPGVPSEKQPKLIVHPYIFNVIMDFLDQYIQGLQKNIVF